MLAKALLKAMLETGVLGLTPKDRMPEFLSSLIMFEGDSNNLKINHEFIISFERN